MMNRWKNHWRPLCRHRNTKHPFHGSFSEVGNRSWNRQQSPRRPLHRSVPPERLHAHSASAPSVSPGRPSSYQTRFYHNTRSYNSDCHLVSVYFTNFPENWKACHFWDTFYSFGEIVDVVIPSKRNFRGQKFGFVRFVDPDNVGGLLSSLNLLWIGGFKLRFYLAKHYQNSRIGKNNIIGKLSPANCTEPNMNLGNDVDNSSKACLSEDNVESGFNPIVCPKIVSCPHNDVEEPTASLPCNSYCSHAKFVSVSMEDDCVVIRVKYADLVKLHDSGLNDKLNSCDPSPACKADAGILSEPLKETLNLVLPPRPVWLSKMKVVKPFRLSPFQLPLSLNISSLANWSTALCSRSKVASKHNVKLASIDIGPFHPRLPEPSGSEECFHNYIDDECNDVGSPCFSLHSRSTEELNMILGVDTNDKELSEDDGSDVGTFQTIVNGGCEANCDELAFFYDTASYNVNIDHVPAIIADLGSNSVEKELSTLPSDALLDAHTNGDPVNLKLPKMKKKRLKNNWTRKKSHSKASFVNTCQSEISEADNLITDEDIQFRNEKFRNEAIKTLEVGKLLGISFEDNEDTIIKKLVDLEYEEWKANTNTVAP